MALARSGDKCSQGRDKAWGTIVALAIEIVLIEMENA